jgi:DNA-binding NarL/FixJ family response regulator
MKPGETADQVLTQALARAADGAFAIGPAGRVVLWNRAAERILGWSAKEVLGRSCCEVLVGSDVNGNRLCYQGCHVMSLVEQLASPEASNGDGAPLLTKRELEILQLMASGANTKALAERLHVSRATIRNHAQNIFAKLGVHSRLEAVAYATQRRLF